MPEDESLSSPGIHYPPPLIFVAGIVLGWLVERLRPLPITSGPSLLRFALAFVFGIAWLLVFGAAWSVFRRERTTLIPNRPATALATTGSGSSRNLQRTGLAVVGQLTYWTVPSS